MSSRRPKVTAKVRGASIISLLQNPYGKRDLLKAILMKTRKTCTSLVIFRPVSLSCDARSANSVSNLPLVGLKKVPDMSRNSALWIFPCVCSEYIYA